MRGDRPRALSHALVAGRVWCICSAYAWCIRGVTRNMCVKCHARDGTLPNLAVVPLDRAKCRGTHGPTLPVLPCPVHTTRGSWHGT